MSTIESQPGVRPAGLAASALARFGRRLRLVLVGQRLMAGLAGVLAWVLGTGLADYTLRLPGWFRAVLLASAIALLAVLAWRRLRPAFALRPKLSTLAMRVENSALGAAHGLRGVLASGVALSETAPDPDTPASILRLRERASIEADARMDGAKPWTLVDLSGLRRQSIWAAILIAVTLGIAIASPMTATTGARRLLLPFGDASWPKRFAVTDATLASVHPRGTAVPVRALVTETSRDEGQTPVSVVYRVVDASGASDFRREPLTPQRVFELTPAGVQGEAYERLLDPPAGEASDEEPAKLEYYFETPDDRTQTATVLLVDQPEVSGITASIVPPEYVSRIAGTWLAGDEDLGEAMRDRGLIGPVLAGSRVTLAATLNKPAETRDPEPVRHIESGEPPADLGVRQDSSVITMEWNATGSARVTLGLQGRYGLESLEDTVLRVEVIEDRPPTAAVTSPPRDESVLATAVVSIETEGRDDVALSGVGIEYERAVVPGGSERSSGAAPESDGEAMVIASVETIETRAAATGTIDLATLGLRAGDELLVYGTAQDVYALDGQTHETVRSEPRRLRVISESELIDELLAELAGVRRTAIRLDEQQAEIDTRLAPDADSPSDDGKSPLGELARRQSSVGESLSAAADTISRVADRIDRNSLGDEGLDRVVRDAAEAADRGARAAERSAQALTEADEAAGDEAQDEGSDTAAEKSEAVQAAAQEESEQVRRAIEDLARALDRGEDSWAVRRALEGILSDQQAVSEGTAEAGASTVGRNADELTEQERSILDEIARRQLEIADRAQEILDELDSRAEEMTEQDPGQSAAMRAASRRGREQGVAQQLREAGRAINQNRGADAGRAQQEAQEQIEEMLNDLEQAERQRDAELKRALLSLVETIQSLIRTQESELARLDRGEADLSAGMERLHRNTLAAQDEAGADQATAGVAVPLREAAGAQASAITRLRATETESARTAEQLSLDKLNAALELAQERLDDAERREQERKRKELQAAYREVLEAQVAISSETGEHRGVRLGRRERAAVRALGEQETELREQIAFLREIFPEITDAGVFVYTHDRLDRTLGGIAARLGTGAVGALDLMHQESVASLLRGLIASLDEPENDEEQFDEGGGGAAGGQGGQQGQQPLIPPMAELNLLKTLQQDVYDQTRSAEDAGIGGEVSDSLSEQQRALAGEAMRLLQELQQSQQPAPEMVPMPEPEGDEE